MNLLVLYERACVLNCCCCCCGGRCVSKPRVAAFGALFLEFNATYAPPNGGAGAGCEKGEFCAGGNIN